MILMSQRLGEIFLQFMSSGRHRLFVLDMLVNISDINSNRSPGFPHASGH